jgi:hypothetical protein
LSAKTNRYYPGTLPRHPSEDEYPGFIPCGQIMNPWKMSTSTSTKSLCGEEIHRKPSKKAKQKRIQSQIDKNKNPARIQLQGKKRQCVTKKIWKSERML